jgi:hypothetical protein
LMDPILIFDVLDPTERLYHIGNELTSRKLG